MTSADHKDTKILVVDKDESACEQVLSVVDAYKDFKVIGQCASAKEAIAMIQAQHPAIVFLAIDLPDLSGFEVIERTRPAHKPKFVMLARNERKAVEAFEHYAFDYILKPLRPERIHLTIMKAREALKNGANDGLQDKLNALFRYVSSNQPAQTPGRSGQRDFSLIPVKRSGRIYFVHTDDIEYIVASGYYIEIFAKGKKHLVRESLKEIAKRLDGMGFLRIHRSVIISVRFLQEIRRNGSSDFNVRMQDGSEFKISKSYKSELFDRIGIRT